QVDKYNVEQGSVRLPGIPDVPYLDVLAALNDTRDKLTIFCVNRHLTQDLAAHISISGFASAVDGLAHTLSATSIYDKNDETHPETVVPQESGVRLVGGKVNYSFRHESVTVLEFHKETDSELFPPLAPWH